MNFDVCVIGHITTDFIQIDGSITTEIPGGTAYYTSMALKSLSLDVAVITKMSRDHRACLLAELEEVGIRVFCEESQQTTVFENIYSREELDTRVQRIRSVASPFSSENLAGISASFFHVGPLTNTDISPDFLREVASKNRPISLDVQGLLREVTQDRVRSVEWEEKAKGLAHVNILKADETEAKILTGEDDLEKAAIRLSNLGPGEVIITSGSKGSLIYAQHEFHRVPAFQVTELVDMTGCGDTYMAGYIHERMKSDNVEKAGKFAAYLASQKLERFGALRPNKVDGFTPVTEL